MTIDQIEKNNEDLILLTGGRNGILGKNLLLEKTKIFETTLNRIVEIFKSRMYVQIEKTSREFEQEYTNHSILLAEKFDLPLIATNDVQFLSKDEFESHEIRVCINKKIKLEDRSNQKEFSDNQFFKSQNEMEKLYIDLPDALENISEVIKRCNFHLDTSSHHLPKFKTPNDVTIDEHFNNLVTEGLLNILKNDKTLNKRDYEERLNNEIKIISKMDFVSYFLIVYEFISWAKNNSIPVGPGRGSGAGSLVAYALGITSIDPIKHCLPNVLPRFFTILGLL